MYLTPHKQRSLESLPDLRSFKRLEKPKVLFDNKLVKPKRARPKLRKFEFQLFFRIGQNRAFSEPAPEGKQNKKNKCPMLGNAIQKKIRLMRFEASQKRYYYLRAWCNFLSMKLKVNTCFNVECPLFGQAAQLIYILKPRTSNAVIASECCFRARI